MLEKKIDLLCIQEPYCFKNQVKGYTTPGLIVVQPAMDEYKWVAAVVNNNTIQVLQSISEETEHVMCFKIYKRNTEICFINVYCQFCLRIEPILDIVEKMIQRITDQRIVITVDANAKSSTWYSDTTDDKGKAIEEFALANKLYILNRNGQPPTYMGPSGTSNIDLTLVSENMLNIVTDWHVSVENTTSDHNLIIFECAIRDQKNRKWMKNDGYNIKRACWDKFHELARTKFNEQTIGSITNAEPDESVRIFNKILKNCCDKAIPKRKQCENSVPWWNKDLDKLRKEVNANKKQLARAYKLNLIDQIEIYQNTYRRSRNRYVKEIRTAKRSTWQNFVTDESNKDPWGIVYKIARDKIRRRVALTAIQLENGQRTQDIISTNTVLINKCAPDDYVPNNELQIEVKKKAQRYMCHNVEQEFTCEEIITAISKFKNKKAPGIDNFSIEIIKHLWNCNSTVVINLLNNCFKKGRFPKAWKVADLRILLKSRDKDTSLLSSYRPISLLPIMGKLLERILINRIQVQYDELKLANSNQFGFKQGKSTEDALLMLKSAIKYSDKKYAVAIFIDIEGAFDNLWWSSIIDRLVEAKIGSTILRMIKDYFNKRTVIIKKDIKVVKKKMAKGCPQGSIIGPATWCWCMDTLLNEFEATFDDEDIQTVAYADDLTIVVKGNTRTEIETHAAKAMSVVNSWCIFNKLKVSSNKTNAMLMKGKLDRERLPKIEINSSKIKYQNSIKYLGIIVDKKMNFIEHSKYLRDKVIKFIMSIKRLANESWGLKTHILRTLYNAVAMPIIKYCSTTWYEKTHQTFVLRNLSALQRTLLLPLTRACRTTSTAAMQVIAGKKPLDLEVTEQALINYVKRNKTVKWKRYEYRRSGDGSKSSLKVIEEQTIKIRQEIIAEWQSRWDSDKNGRHTYKFMPKVNLANELNWFKPNKEMTYLITGYGPINGTLYNRGLEDDEACSACKEHEETPEHMIFECYAYDEFRSGSTKNIKNKLPDLLNNEEEYKLFQELSKKIFDKRREDI
ncbi:Retrovirus-related Pol polyprotein from type-1 retrotransposable element R1 (Fragment) [Anthophora quadrimaculata]